MYSVRPHRTYISVEGFLRRFPIAAAIAGVVVGKYIHTAPARRAVRSGCTERIIRRKANKNELKENKHTED